MNNDIILKAENLYFSYDDENSHSLNGLSLEIKRGQKVAFMGSNGSGKSTFYAATAFTAPPPVPCTLTENRSPMTRRDS